MACSAEDVKAAARAWWEDEIREAEMYIAALMGQDSSLSAAEILRSIDERPTFGELDDLLAGLEASA
jgi:hypothetical protein